VPQQHYDDLVRKLTIIFTNRPHTKIAVENTLSLLDRELHNYKNQYRITDTMAQECIDRMDKNYNKFCCKLRR
jgi:hypothetical protein